MNYLSVCSGIEAATVAWLPLGWNAAAYSEIDRFPRAVLAHHYPDTPNWGDMTKFEDWPDASIDVLVGGTPCQSFSVAGLRKGFADRRGNLALTYLAIAARYRPKWVVWENVAGILSSNRGRDFGSFVGGLGKLGYGVGYRILDAEYFGVPQRRRRVFVVGYLGDWRRAAAVLFERESLSGRPPPRRGKEQTVAALTANGIGVCGPDDNQAQAGHLIATKSTKGAVGVRRLMPIEAERLFGLPGNYTAVPYRGRLVAKDKPRYRALGNTMAVPVVRWIGERIVRISALDAVT